MNNLKDIVDNIEEGKYGISTWRKSPSGVTPTGLWYDLSMAPGNPVPQYYASTPLIGITMSKRDLGINYYSGSLTQSTYIKSFTVMANAATAIPMPFMLLDYLIFYPFTDDGTTDEQIVSGSPTRYTDGEGVQIMAISVAGRTGGQTFSVTYVNQDGVEGRQTVVATQNTTSITGNIVTSDAATLGSSGPFLTLQQGDSGVRRIQSVTMGNVDVGLMTLVLVKPIFGSQIAEITAPVEKDFILDTGLLLHEIKSDAYLNLICLPKGTLAATALHGTLETFWK